MRERVHHFGSDGCLVGIVTEPDPGRSRAGAPALILTNVGMNHRVGPNRMNVELARDMASRGFLVLRFDLSGRGDSEARRDGTPEDERGEKDMQEAMDFLARTRGADRFALVGLCSGVDAVHPASLADRRVVGVTWLDGYCYRTWKFRLRWHTVRYLKGHLWRRMIREQMGRLRGGHGAPRAPQERLAVFDRAYPAPALLAGDVEKLVARGTRLLVIYTGGAQRVVNYRDQFFDMLSLDHLRDRIEVELWPRCDHVFSTAAQREQLTSRLVGWLESMAEQESRAAG